MCITRQTILELVDTLMRHGSAKTRDVYVQLDHGATQPENFMRKFLKNRLPLCSSHINPLAIPYLTYRQAKVVADDDQQPGHPCSSLACDRILLCVVCQTEKDFWY